MKKALLIISILSIMFLAGCGVFNLNGWVCPDDLEFLAVVESLDTPEKIANYMEENFTYEMHVFYAPDPYTLWKTGKGDCNDFATFINFVASYNSYTSYMARIYWKNSSFWTHYIGIIKLDDNYVFFDNTVLINGEFSTFREIIERDSIVQNKIWAYYKVYDYENNIIEEGYK